MHRDTHPQPNSRKKTGRCQDWHSEDVSARNAALRVGSYRDVDGATFLYTYRPRITAIAIESARTTKSAYHTIMPANQASGHRRRINAAKTSPAGLRSNHKRARVAAPATVAHAIRTILLFIVLPTDSVSTLQQMLLHEQAPSC